MSDTLLDAPPAPPAPEAPPDWQSVEALPDFKALPYEQQSKVLSHYTDTLRSHVVSQGADPAVVDGEIAAFSKKKLSDLQTQPSGPTVGVVPPGALPNIAALKAGQVQSAGTDPAVTKFFETPLVPGSVTKWANPLTLGVESLKRTFPDSTAVKIASGITEGGADAIAGFTSPANAAILPFAAEGAAAKILGGVFAGQAATQLPAEWKAFGEATDPGEKTRIAVGALASLGIPALAFAHSSAGHQVDLEQVHSAIEKAPTEALEIASSDPEFRKSAPYDLKLVDNELAKRHLSAAPDEAVQIAGGDHGFAGAAPDMHAAVLTELERRGLQPADAERVTAVREAERQAAEARDAGLDETAKALLEKADAARATVTQPGPPDLNPRFTVVGSRLRGDHTAASDYDLVTQLSPEEQHTYENAPEGSFPQIPQEIKDAAQKHDVFILGEKGHLWKVEPNDNYPGKGEVVVERVSQKEQNILTGTPKGEQPPPFTSLEDTVARWKKPSPSTEPISSAPTPVKEGATSPASSQEAPPADLSTTPKEVTDNGNSEKGKSSDKGQAAAEAQKGLLSDAGVRPPATDSSGSSNAEIKGSITPSESVPSKNPEAAAPPVPPVSEGAAPSPRLKSPDDIPGAGKSKPSVYLSTLKSKVTGKPMTAVNLAKILPSPPTEFGYEAVLRAWKEGKDSSTGYISWDDAAAKAPGYDAGNVANLVKGVFSRDPDAVSFSVNRQGDGTYFKIKKPELFKTEPLPEHWTDMQKRLGGEAAAIRPADRAHESATTDAVREILGPKAPVDLDSQVAKRYATAAKIVSERGGDAQARDAMLDLVRDDLLANARAGDPFTVGGKPYSVEARLIGTAAKPYGKLTNYLDKREQGNVRGEDAGVATENAVATQSTHEYKSAVEDVIQTTERVLSEFAAGDETKAEAAKLVLRDAGFANGEQGRPTAAAKALAADPAFKSQVQKGVFAKIAAEIKSRFEESVLDSVRITNNTDALNQATANVVNAFQPGAMARIGRVARGWFGAIAGKTLPRFTVADREVGEKGARYISSKIAAEPLAGVLAEKVLSDGVDAKKFGAALTEDNLRSVRQENLDRAAAAKTPEEAAEYQDRADRTASMVGPKKAFADEKEYQSYLADPATQAAIERHKQMWQDQVEPMYRKAQRLDPDAELPSRGLQTDARINLFALKDGEPGVARVSGPPSGGLLNTLRKKSPFATEAKGTGANYETAYGELIKNTFGQQLSIANYNDFVGGMVDKGLAQIGKPGQHVEIDGESTVSFPLERRTIISDGKVFPANEHVYVKQSLSDEFRAAVNVDPSRRAQLAGKVFGIVNNAALYGLTDATVHVSNLATALFTRPAVTGRTITDSLLSTFGRTDVPVALTKAVIKGFSDNSAQMAELAAIGAARASSTRTMMGLGWSNKLIHWADGTTRLVLDDAFKNLVKDGLVENTETNRREFVNQVGQYNRRTSTGLNRALKDAGLAPFVTAGTTFNRLGLRTVGLQSGASHTSALSHAITMANVASKWVGAAVLIGTTNYLLTHDKGGGLLGRPGVPLGNIDTGQTDENDKPLSIPAAAILGLERGLRVTGIRGAVQATRNELTPGDVKDAALRDVVNTAISPYTGPAVRFGSAIIYNRAPGIGAPPIFRVVPPTGDDTQRSQIASNLLHAVADVNPLTAAAVDQKENPSARPVDILHRQLPRFTLRPSNSVEMMDNYPTIVHKAQVNSFIEDTIYTARRLKPDDRPGYVEDQVSQLPVEDQKHLRDQLKRRGVRY